MKGEIVSSGMRVGGAGRMGDCLNKKGSLKHEQKFGDLREKAMAQTQLDLRDWKKKKKGEFCVSLRN